MNEDSFEYEICDSGRTNKDNIVHYNRTNYAEALRQMKLPSSFETIHDSNCDLLHDRLKCNELINPLVSAIRKRYGVPHTYQSYNFVPAENGDYILLPNWDDDFYFDRYSLYASGYFDRMITDYSDGIKEEIVKLVLVNRFHIRENDNGLITGEYTESCSRLIKYSILEAALGYDNCLSILKRIDK